jgi:hypothetical protein
MCIVFSNTGYFVMQNASVNIKNNREIVLAAVSKDSSTLRYAGDRIYVDFLHLNV